MQPMDCYKHVRSVCVWSVCTTCVVRV